MSSFISYKNYSIQKARDRTTSCVMSLYFPFVLFLKSSSHSTKDVFARHIDSSKEEYALKGISRYFNTLMLGSALSDTFLVKFWCKYNLNVFSTHYGRYRELFYYPNWSYCFYLKCAVKWNNNSDICNYNRIPHICLLYRDKICTVKSYDTYDTGRQGTIQR